MKLRYITCSDPREMVPVHKIMELGMESPLAEIAVQAHPSKMSVNMGRHTWFDSVVHTARNADTPINLALHVNLDWANDLCLGKMVPELADWINARRNDGAPVVRRIQVNMNGSNAPEFHARDVAHMIAQYPKHEFIFQYGPEQATRMALLYGIGANFSVLYDTSGGRGTEPDKIETPLFTNRSQGYSGGISPDNVMRRLGQIESVAKNRNDIWIDAEGKLKDPETKQFDPDRAREYIIAALNWQRLH